MAYLKTRRRSDGTPSYVVCWTDLVGRECQQTFRQQSRANSALRQRVADEARRELADETASRLVFKVVADDWLAATALEVKSRTVDAYRSILAVHILPVFGERRVGSVTSHEVQQWLVGLTQTGLHDKTIRNIYTPLASTFQYAVDHRMIRQSPCTRMRLPRRPHMHEFEGHFLPASQLDALATDLDRSHPTLGFAVRLVSATGLRAAEVSALRLCDVDLERGVVHVRRTLARDKRSRKWVVGTPKSKRSRREVPVLDEAVLQRLRQYVANHPRRDDPDALLLYSREHGGGHAFDPGRPFDPDNFSRRYLKPALRRAGLAASGPDGIRFHDLRHSCASLWFEAGIPLAVISRWLGHASVAVTDRVYVHLQPNDDYTQWRERYRIGRDGGRHPD